MNLYRFHGGLALAEHKREATQHGITPCPPPGELVIPLAQHAGAPAQCVVSVGQRVRRGQVIGRAVGERSAAVHASVSGVVGAIEARAVASASSVTEQCVVINNDGQDEAETLAPLHDWRNMTPAMLVERLFDAGIAGLGGAVFPTALKVAAPAETLILNGAECEPYIACDETLLREHATSVIDGALLLRHIVGATRVLIALEERMGEAHVALSKALGSDSNGKNTSIELVRVPTVYPAGGERQLIRVLTGREVPSGGLPRDIGVLCVNVATAAASWRAVVHGEALTERIVTVTGHGVRRPGNFLVRLGTPLAHLIEAAGGYTAAAARLVMGGPMMGIALPHDDIPLVKAGNCVLVLGADDVRERAPELPCIRCGECAQVCPAQLLPQQLLHQIKGGDPDTAGQHGLLDCIECGLCAFVCPSQIPLVDWYRLGKSELRESQNERTRADHARERYHAREVRRARDAAERVARVSAREGTAASVADAELQASTAPAPAIEPIATSAPAATPMDKAAVLAAIARGRAKKHTPQRDDPEQDA